MKSNRRERVLRLIDACEEFIKEEAFALRKKDLAYLQEILAKKSKIIERLIAESKDFPEFNDKQSELSLRMARIIKAQQANYSNSQKITDEMGSEVRQLRRGRNQAKSVRKSYVGKLPDRTGGVSFSA